MQRKRLSVILAVVFVLVLAVPALAITNCAPDGDTHPYVGLLVFDSAPGKPGWRCSGTLIAPTVVLTAGHCTDGAVAARIWFDKDVTYENVPFPLYPYGGPGSGAVQGTAYTNPEYRSPDNPYGGGNGLLPFSYRDVGVVVLDEPVYMDEYGQLPSAGLVVTLKNKTLVDFVGYGVSEQVMVEPGQSPRARWTGPRIRMYAPSELVSGQFVHGAEYIKFALNPGGGSGAPASAIPVVRISWAARAPSCPSIRTGPLVDPPDMTNVALVASRICATIVLRWFHECNDFPATSPRSRQSYE